jgi:cytidylate kinase
MIVTISGGPGTGTTSVAKELADMSGFELIHVGERFRDKAKAAGMPLQEYLEHANRNQEEADTCENVIVEGRIAGFVINSHLDVQLTCPIGIVAQRVADREGKAYDLSVKETVDRMKIEQQTYKEIYGFDIYEETWPFDIILDSDSFPIETCATLICVAMDDYLEGAENYDYS